MCANVSCIFGLISHRQFGTSHFNALPVTIGHNFSDYRAFSWAKGILLDSSESCDMRTQQNLWVFQCLLYRCANKTYICCWNSPFFFCLYVLLIDFAHLGLLKLLTKPYKCSSEKSLLVVSLLWQVLLNRLWCLRDYSAVSRFEVDSLT